GGEADAPPVHFVVEGLAAQAITRENESLPVRVPQGDAEHPVQPRYELQAEILVQVENRLTVTRALEPMPPGEKLGPERSVVVNLAVEHHPEAAVLVRHRLVAAGNVDDAE